MSARHGWILTINTGSSSLKAALYEPGSPPRRSLDVQVSRIGGQGSNMRVRDASGTEDNPVAAPDHPSALALLSDLLAEKGLSADLRGVGHRVVHGGPTYSEPQLVTDNLLHALEALVPIDPMHLPQAISAIEAMRKTHAHVPQVACFDTAFHRRMPRVAQMYALPEEIVSQGVLRYGFHGLSYEYILAELGRVDPMALSGRVIIAHLGNGASMAAVRDGMPVDTTMGFTPTGGLVMGTRSGDLDPGVLVYLIDNLQMDGQSLNDLVNWRSGLLAVSGETSDVAELLARRDDDARAADALALFCYTARKYLGALAASLGGVDTLVFTGGIGEHAVPVRAEICQGLDFLGIEIDEERNVRSESVISTDGARVRVRVMQTDEDQMIAHHTQHVLQMGG